MAKGTHEQMLRALKPLGDYQMKGGQLCFNCPRCEKELKNPINKYNLELGNKNKNSVQTGFIYHCWACGISGSLYTLIKQYGYVDFAPLFKSDKKANYEEVQQKHISLPLELANVYNYTEVYNYLKKRGLTKEIIKEREIKYCYDGYFKNNIIFPSYNSDGRLTAVVIQNFTTKKYRKFLDTEFVCFYETFINKKSLIVITEGAFDGLVVPNSLILLGTEISDKILDFLTHTDVLLILDADVNKDLIDKKVTQLKSVCNSVQTMILTTEQDDVNYFYVKNTNFFKRKLSSYYKQSTI
jgi:hypothetical protein